MPIVEKDGQHFLVGDDVQRLREAGQRYEHTMRKLEQQIRRRLSCPDCGGTGKIVTARGQRPRGMILPCYRCQRNA